MACLADSDVLIDFLRGTKIEPILKEQEFGLHISAITAFELLHGAYSSGRATNVKSTQELIKRLHLHSFGANTADIAAKMQTSLKKGGKTVGFRDVFIAASAAEHNLEVLTNNKKEFQRIPGIKLKNPSN